MGVIVCETMSNPVVEPAAEAAAGGAAPAAEAPMFPQFPGYKPSGRVISTRVLGTNHMGGGMPGAYNMAPQQYRGFNFVPRTSEGSTSHTSCPYYGFHDLPPGCAYVDPKVSVYPDTMHMRDPG